MPISILIIDDSEIMLKMLSAAFRSDGYELFTAQSGKEALEITKRIVPSLILLDVVLPDIDGYQVCKTIRNDPRTVHVPIMMLTGFSDLENRLQAFDSGADDFMQKPFQLEELRARVKAHLRRASSTQTHLASSVRPQRIAVFSLRGGLGVSTLAVNLAAGLVQLWEAPTLLLDLAFLNGQAALMLDVTLRNTWADLGLLKPEEIDSEALERVVLHHGSGLEVLAAPRRVEEAELITEKHVQRLIELAGNQYRYLVLDLPHDFSPTTLAALDLADVLLLLTAPDLASVRCATNALNVFKSLGYPDDKVQLVLNWNFSTSGLARKEIEKVLQKPVSVVIPNLPESLVMAITLGKPVVLEKDKPEAALFEDLAYLWSSAEDQKLEPANPSITWKRVTERARRRRQSQGKP